MNRTMQALIIVTLILLDILMLAVIIGGVVFLASIGDTPTPLPTYGDTY